ncbi:MAG TPA: prenyltransferase [Gemmatimonadales bacterium]
MAATAAPLRAPGLWGRLRPWIALQELPKHLANLLPFFLGTTLAYWQSGRVDWTVFGVALLALFLLTDGTYIANEYFDYENDRLNLARIGGVNAVGVTTTGGTRVLVNGLIPRRHALVAAIVAFALAIPVGLFLQLGLGTGPLTIPLGLLALFIGWFYSAPPIKASYRGLGEAFIAVGQGIVIFGAYYVQQGFSTLPLLVSLPWFLALPALKVIREFPDYDADRATGKRGLTLRLGRDWGAVVYDILISLAVTSFVPLYFLLGSPTFWVVLLPAFFLVRSVTLVVGGGWRDPERAEAGAVSGFIGMLLIPLALMVAFLGAALLGL